MQKTQNDAYDRKNGIKTTIQLCLFAGLKAFTPKELDNYPIVSGMTVHAVMEEIGVPLGIAKRIFIDGKKGSPDQALMGGERVSIFPPVAGG